MNIYIKLATAMLLGLTLPVMVSHARNKKPVFENGGYLLGEVVQTSRWLDDEKLVDVVEYEAICRGPYHQVIDPETKEVIQQGEGPFFGFDDDMAKI